MNEFEKRTVEAIRGAYTVKTEGDMERLRKLDRKVRRPAMVFALTLGIAGALILGVGMCLAMGVIGDLIVLGVVVGVVGIAIVAANYFVYRAILESRRKKYADEILKLSEKLLHD